MEKEKKITITVTPGEGGQAAVHLEMKDVPPLDILAAATALVRDAAEKTGKSSTTWAKAILHCLEAEQ